MKGRDWIIWVNEKNTSTWRYRTTNLKNCWMNLRLVFTCCHFNDLEKNLSEVQGKVASNFAKQHNESYSQRLTTLNEIFTWRHSIPSFPAVLLGHSEAGSRPRTSEVGSPHGRPGGSQHFHVQVVVLVVPIKSRPTAPSVIRRQGKLMRLRDNGSCWFFGNKI